VKSSSSAIGVGVLGMGFMGRMHVSAVASAAQAGVACRLVAVCDQDATRMESAGPPGNVGPAAADFDRSSVRKYTAAESILADPSVDLLCICTHTDTHVDLAMRALAAGKHVLVEKPVATTSADARKLATAAAATSAPICMPAMCMRFWPGWSWLKQRIEDNTYGRVRSAVFERLASPPGWAPDFYRDTARSGGALIDLHIHDADFVRWLFGRPESVASTGSLDHVTTLYRYPDGPPHVVAEGGWDHTPGFPFKMRFVVAFEKATAEFDSGREPPLVVACDGSLNAVPLESITGWDLEMRHVLTAIREGRPAAVTMDEAVAVLEMLEAERRSLESRACVALP
jgi:predicted dehydrogenase